MIIICGNSHLHNLKGVIALYSSNINEFAFINVIQATKNREIFLINHNIPYFVENYFFIAINKYLDVVHLTVP